MASFVLLYTGGGMPATEAEQARVLKAWEGWFGKLGGAVVDAGNPFTPATKTLSGKGAVTDGAVGVMATGYSIIKADSLNAAVDLAKGCPQLDSGGKITVYEILPTM